MWVSLGRWDKQWGRWTREYKWPGHNTWCRWAVHWNYQWWCRSSLGPSTSPLLGQCCMCVYRWTNIHTHNYHQCTNVIMIILLIAWLLQIEQPNNFFCTVTRFTEYSKQCTLVSRGHTLRGPTRLVYTVSFYLNWKVMVSLNNICKISKPAIKFSLEEFYCKHCRLHVYTWHCNVLNVSSRSENVHLTTYK